MKGPGCFCKALLLSAYLAGLVWAAETPALWIDVPFVRQERNGCGAASTAMLIQYWQRQQGNPQAEIADPIQIQRALYSDQAHGIYASSLERYFSEHGFRTFAFQGTWSDLKSHIEKGRPLIIALKPRSGAQLHYVVVAGVDEARNLVFVNDPAERKLLSRDWQELEGEWKGSKYWTLLAIPKEGEASFR
jgi:ABC-type bacteriocin/lantibiotic exporter with double-glycine peptidase domain